MRISFLLILLTFSIQSFGQTLKDCSTCSTQIIKIEQIKDLSIDEIRFLTNDLFARKGYKFKVSTIDNYYSTKTWYKPIEDNNKIEYNSTEKQNIKLFQERTKVLKEDREKLIEDLKLFKVALLQNNEEILNTNFNFSVKKILGEKNSENYKYFFEVIHNLNVDEIGWFKKQAHYKKKIDNLSETYGYEMIIESNNVFFRYDYDSGSEDIKDELYTSDIYKEFTYFWNFKFINNQLKFIDFGVAG
ncbi:YARHG domain-containing protein [Flavobacterium sp. Fl-77]|uniref:YARHG domain-containing protein n=1 Tax=Flavobacterium flavipigmentatum TaxID=2893884 RepID=A0AAJ2SDP4_9FLAO|nr:MULTISPECIES: YARHG domain-containing protein [unclassified Flavobacterium]MDX6183790.1 YARHG domain-containing protein [Flavobacterium sp. Fl-33]MDX6187249.1 YARHG domain-containing protein [Flavobacterium sp. Fl-77]UFH38064.1 YARHG domain-containing protein [Flavobacterium sp. F-70]